MRFTQFFESRARELSPELKQWVQANFDSLSAAINNYADSGRSDRADFGTIDLPTKKVFVKIEPSDSANGSMSPGGVLSLNPRTLAHRPEALKDTLHHELIHAEDPSFGYFSRNTDSAMKINAMKKAGMDDRAIAKKMRKPLDRVRGYLGTDDKSHGETYYGSRHEFNAHIAEYIESLRNYAATDPTVVPRLKEWLRGGLKDTPPVDAATFNKLKSMWEKDHVLWKRTQTVLANSVLEMEAGGGRRQTVTKEREGLKRGDKITWVSGQYRDWKHTGTYEKTNMDGTIELRTNDSMGKAIINKNDIVNIEPVGARPKYVAGQYDTNGPAPVRAADRLAGKIGGQRTATSPEPAKSSLPTPKKGDTVTWDTSRYKDWKQKGTFVGIRPDGLWSIALDGDGYKVYTIDPEHIVSVEPKSGPDRGVSRSEPAYAGAAAAAKEKETPSGPFRAAPENAKLMKPGMILRNKNSWGGYKINKVHTSGVDASALDRSGNVEMKNGRPVFMTLLWSDLRNATVDDKFV